MATIIKEPVIKPMALLNGSELARAVGASRTTIQAAKKAGFQFLYGDKTTLESYYKWRATHPEFRQSKVYLRVTFKQPGQQPSSKAPARHASLSDKRGGR